MRIRKFRINKTEQNQFQSFYFLFFEDIRKATLFRKYRAIKVFRQKEYLYFKKQQLKKIGMYCTGSSEYKKYRKICYFLLATFGLLKKTFSLYLWIRNYVTDWNGISVRETYRCGVSNFFGIITSWVSRGFAIGKENYKVLYARWCNAF